MKTLPVALLFSVLSFNAFALENGNYINKEQGANDPLMYKSVELDNSSCANGGFIVKFNNADPMNFCVGQKERSVFKYKKCVGKEVSEYPIKVCLGVKKTAELITEKEVSTEENNALVLSERNIDDKKLYFEQEYKLIDAGEGKIKLIHSFISHTDGRSGTNEINFEKN